MSLLVRYLAPKRATLWAKADDPTRWRSGNFPHELLQDLHDPRGGLSFYEVTSRRDPDVRRIAAALNFPADGPKTSIESADFRFVKISSVQKIGLSIISSPGDTKDNYINGLHREIKGIDGLSAIKLAKLMCFSANAPFAAQRVASEISTRVKSGALPEPSHQMLKGLLSEKVARIVYV